MSETVQLVARDESPGTRSRLDAAVTNTRIPAYAGRATLSDVVAYNPNAIVVYIQLFDAATVGAATTPIAAVPLTANSTTAISLTLGWYFDVGIVYAASTSPTTLVAPGSAIVMTYSLSQEPVG